MVVCAIRPSFSRICVSSSGMCQLTSDSALCCLAFVPGLVVAALQMGLSDPRLQFLQLQLLPERGLYILGGFRHPL